MEVNKSGAQKAIRDFERELKNGLRNFDEGDYTGALRYFQECGEYAAKAVLIAYGLDYPKVHGVGRFLAENMERSPGWFKTKVETMSEAIDMLARSRPRFRYPYEYESEDHKAFAEKILPAVKETFENCKKLIKELFEK